MSQTNVKFGPIALNCGEDLSAVADHLVVIGHSAGTPELKLPISQADHALYLVLEGSAAGETGYFLPLSPAANVRMPLVGTCNPGDTLVLADPAVEGQSGKVTVLPVDPGTYRVVAVAEEQGVDTQLVLSRPANLGEITISVT
jgi:hypothetical protein